MKKEQILQTAEKLSPKFEKASEKTSYQLRGILNSEALLLATITAAMNVGLFVESGRARGYSTKLLADFFNHRSDLEIASIDFDKYSEDSQYSEKVLESYKNVSLIYGDTHKIISNLITEDCVVFIDGPKGDEALLLAANLLERKEVKAICIHDLHKNTFHRDICEIIFNNTFFSDDKDFVNLFSGLDQDCWKKMDSESEAPYTRKGKKIESYGSTLAIIFNEKNTLIDQSIKNYRQYRYRENSPRSLKETASSLMPARIKIVLRNARDKFLR